MLRKIKYYLLLTTAFLVLLSSGSWAQEEQEFQILFTHDLHDNLQAKKYLIDGDLVYRGGYSRISSLIEELRRPNSLLLDAGDYSMGSLFQTIYSEESPGLRLMGLMGYDAVTLGNHEFDFRMDGLNRSLKSAMDSGDPLPSILASNFEFPQELNQDLADFKDIVKSYPIKPWKIFEIQGLKLGVFGLLGPEAISNAPMAQLDFIDYIEASKKMVEELKEEGADLIIALSHTGTNKNPKKSEDQILAKKLDGIDVIISGHSHSLLNEPIIENNTFIVSAGRYGDHLGELILKKEDDSWQLDSYKVHEINQDLDIDYKIEREIKKFKSKVEESYLKRYDLGFDQIIARSNFDFTSFLRLGKDSPGEGLGNLIADSYIYGIKKAEGDNYKEIALSIAPNGTIRDSISKGYISVNDVFNILPLGIGPDGLSGYPLIDVYLTGKELKTTIEVDASIGSNKSFAKLFFSGVEYEYNPNRFIFNKTTNAYLVKEDGTKEEIIDDQLYRVVSGLYTAQMLSIVGDESYGLMKIQPKNQEGNPIDDFDSRIIYDENGQELKEWVSLLSYLRSFPEEFGYPTISSYYKTDQDRKLVDDNSSFLSIIKAPNSLYIKIYSAIAIIILIIVLIVRRRRKKKRDFLFY